MTPTAFTGPQNPSVDVSTVITTPTSDVLRKAASVVREETLDGSDRLMLRAPGAALALADWLDWMAGRSQSSNGIDAMRGRGLEQALSFALAYLDVQ